MFNILSQIYNITKPTNIVIKPVNDNEIDSFSHRNPNIAPNIANHHILHI